MKQALLLLVAVFIIFQLWLACWFELERLIPDPEERGHFGDQFGAVNALFTGLAFAGLTATLYAQHTESKRREQRFQTELTQRRAESLYQLSWINWELLRREDPLQVG